MDIRENTSVASLNKVSSNGIIDKDQEIKTTEKLNEKMSTKCNSIYQNVGSLSGGNQQKVVLAKWLMTEPDILFLDEPTRGIDVGAKYEIYTIIEEMAASGKSICIISSELPEIIGMCDRIYTMNNGKLTGEIARADANQETLMSLMTMEA